MKILSQYFVGVTLIYQPFDNSEKSNIIEIRKN